MESTLHQLGVDPSALILQIIGFFLLFLILKKYVFGKVGDVIEERKRNIQDRMAKLVADQEELDRMHEKVKQEMAEIEIEARSRMQTAIEDANAQREKILELAAQDAKQALTKARQEIQREKNQAIMELRSQAGDLAMQIAGRVLDVELDQARHKEVINGFIDQLPSSKN
ncbi:MAG: F0F1 ATP synthase subunit B [Gemmatimonadota bacterium]|nr:F0F1 ATP synthase subunit B [Gemmatimonadota bacterium]